MSVKRQQPSARAQRRRRIINTYLLPSYIACCGGPIYNNVFRIYFRYSSCTNGLEVAMFIASYLYRIIIPTSNWKTTLLYYYNHVTYACPIFRAIIDGSSPLSSASSLKRLIRSRETFASQDQPLRTDRRFLGCIRVPDQPITFPHPYTRQELLHGSCL